ncbi:MAG TPA: lysylphosphatidylglycerol synthase domain-containing protein [Solirubrobacteraceae bacterium]
MRIALVSPYSWTYPGGVTRHIEALAAELQKMGCDVSILAPFDPEDSLATRLHRGARPQPRAPAENLIPLGRTIGLPANGAVSNLAMTPSAVLALRAALRDSAYDVVHIHDPVAPLLGWDATCSTRGAALVGTFHTYSENRLTNGGAALLGAGRRMNRLHARIAVSEAAAWTAARFFGGRYTIIPNGVHVEAQPTGQAQSGAEPDAPLRILFIGQAVARKGLPVLLSAFEALRDHVPATLTLVGANTQEIAPMLLDDHGVRALGKVSEQQKRAELERAQVLCAPSLHGESFGMVLTEAFAAATPVVASDIPGYRDVVRDGVDGLLVAPGDPLELAQALRRLALDAHERARMARAAHERAQRFAWPHVAAEVLEVYERSLVVKVPRTRLRATAVRYGLAPADLLPRVPPRRLETLQRAAARPARRVSPRLGGRVVLIAASLAALALAAFVFQRVGVAPVIASLVASSPGLVAAGLALMCASMIARGFAWHAILSAAPTWRRAKRRDAMQGTFIGVLMSSTLPARLGEPSRALIVARRLGRARETLPVVLGTMVSQTLLNLLALGILGSIMFSSIDLFNGHERALLAVALAPIAALLVVFLAPVLVPAQALSRSQRLGRLFSGARASLLRVRDGLRVFRDPYNAALALATQLAAWGLQLLSCYLLLAALGLSDRAGFGAAAAVLFTVNATAIVPATPANVGVFQAACVAVLVGAYHVSTADALAYGIILQAVEVLTALLMGMPALVNEGLSWREVRLRTMHATPVKLPALPAQPRAVGRGERHSTAPLS